MQKYRGASKHNSAKSGADGTFSRKMAAEDCIFREQSLQQTRELTLGIRSFESIRQVWVRWGEGGERDFCFHSSLLLPSNLPLPPPPPKKKKNSPKKKTRQKNPKPNRKKKKKTTKINLPQILWSSVCPFQSLSHSEFHCKSSLIPTLASLSNPVPFQSSSVVTNALMSKCVWRQKSDNCGICKVSLIWTHLMLKWWSKAELLS